MSASQLIKRVIVMVGAGAVAKAVDAAKKGGAARKAQKPPANSTTPPVSLPDPKPGDGTQKPDPIRTGHTT